MAKLLIKSARLSFPDLAEAKQYQGQGPFNYSATFLVPPDSEADLAIKAEIERVAREAWPKTYAKELPALMLNPMKAAYISGDLKSYDGYAGMMALTAKRKQEDGRPQIEARDGTPVMAGDDGFPYAGCHVHATVEIWAQDNQYGKGIRCTLRGVRFAKDGDAFGGSGHVGADEFAGLIQDDEEALV
jgi:hypothetical protein